MEPMINIALRAARKAGENIVRASDDLDRIDVLFGGTARVAAVVGGHGQCVGCNTNDIGVAGVGE